MNKVVNIAIDGPAGAGKSTIARRLAYELGYVYVDTGAMYRAIAYFILQQGILSEDEAAISEASARADVSISYRDGEQHVILNNEDVSTVIRREEVGRMASAISIYPDVRRKLVALQQKLAEATSVIMDGRDIGTVVLPNADVKIYMTASSAVRAKRRYEELRQKGQDCDLSVIEQDIIDRDERDMHRTESPLRQAEDAVLLDTSDLNIDEVIEQMKTIVSERLA